MDMNRLVMGSFVVIALVLVGCTQAAPQPTAQTPTPAVAPNATVRPTSIANPTPVQGATPMPGAATQAAPTPVPTFGGTPSATPAINCISPIITPGGQNSCPVNYLPLNGLCCSSVKGGAQANATPTINAGTGLFVGPWASLQATQKDREALQAALGPTATLITWILLAILLAAILYTIHKILQKNKKKKT